MANLLLGVSALVFTLSAIAFLIAFIMKKRTLIIGSAFTFGLACIAVAIFMSAVLPGGIPAF